MKALNIYTGLISALCLFGTLGCEKEEYAFGELKAPESLTLTTTVEGKDASNPEGNGSGNVTITAKAQNALTYKIDFGDGKSQMVPSGTIVHKYASPGTQEYNIVVSAVGTGGIQTVTSTKVKVYVRFEIPADIVTYLTNDASKVWATDKEVDGHFGVGPTDRFDPFWYSATPNSREACAYDDLITFSKDANGNIFINVDNKGESFSIGGATAFYGFSGPDGCYPINTGGKKKLIFMASTSGSTSAVSRMVDFEVPGNGIVNFGTGATVYEILSITATQLHVRSIGVTGIAWYMKLKAQ